MSCWRGKVSALPVPVPAVDGCCVCVRVCPVTVWRSGISALSRIREGVGASANPLPSYTSPPPPCVPRADRSLIHQA